MKLTFVNGTALQKAACRTAAHNLLNFPFDDIPLTVTVEFVADPEPSIHNEFAWAETTYGSANSYIRIDEDAPDWPHPWNGVLFLQEVFAHELGHAFYSALPEASRVVVAKMFGALSDELGELKPPGSKWEDRILEGICETFKDAFLPQRFRKLTNRTNRRISINKYPEFRSLWRSGSANVSAGGTLIVPRYQFENIYKFTAPPDNSYFVRVDKDDNFATPYELKLQVVYDHPNPPAFTLSSIGEGLWSYHEHVWEDKPGWQEYLANSDTGAVDTTTPESDSGLLLPPGTKVDFTFDFPSASFFEAHDSDSPGLGCERPYEGEVDAEGFPPAGYNPEDSGIHLRVFFMYYDEKDKAVAWEKWLGAYLARAKETYPNSTPSLWAYAIERYADARGNALPLSLNIPTQVPDNVPTVATCGGEMVRVRIYTQVIYHWARPEGVGECPPPPSYSLAEIRERLPVSALNTLRHICAEGTVIGLPTPELGLGGHAGGRVPSPHVIRG